MGDYREFASILDSAMKVWGIWAKDTGYVDGKLISDTKEIMFDPDHARFSIANDQCGYFSGAPEKEIRLSDKISVQANNERLTLALLPLEGKEGEYLLTAMGKTGTDQYNTAPGPEVMPGFAFTAVRLDGKLYAETLEGRLLVQAGKATLTVLDPVGKELAVVEGSAKDGVVSFDLDGTVPGVHYHLVTE